ncbi:VirK/YbjX family protein [Martelella alba]|uniref:DUF535 domain-containing protein n=1 Tax=Martelella alba TaxID=2590451 RepID=A0ABY2SQ47_9HYPH|nr:VirK/YbjX family protein [Martelella alba]TKI08221.1 DUF535 domain-containing protein [Martelella alba]
MEQIFANGSHNKNKGGLSLFIDLLRATSIPDELWRERLFRIKFGLRTLSHPIITLKILNQIVINPVWKTAFAAQTKLPDKIHKPYLYLGLSVRQRASVLFAHYNFIDKIQNPTIRDTFLSPHGNVVCLFSGKEGETFSVKMGSIGRSEREGETNLFLYMDDTRLAALTFSITPCQSGYMIIIGGFQGANRATPHDVIKQATKSCHGLFPKRLLLECLQCVAAKMNIQRIMAVSDAGHVFYSWRYRHRKKEVFKASYNEFWESIGAVSHSNALYDLPLRIARKDMSELPSKKRAEYKRRYLLLDALNGSVELRFGGDDKTRSTSDADA